MKLSEQIRGLINRGKKSNTASTYEFGSPVPAPHQVKQKTIIDYGIAHKISTLVETGTFRGDMVKAALPHFDTIYSVEVNPALAEEAKKRFINDSKVRIMQGDSATVLSSILTELNAPALFWLDGHYSGGVTGKGAKNTPIIEELKSIFHHSIKNHIILIDDARCFIGEHDYPTLFEIYELVKGVDKRYQLNVKDDIIRIIHEH